LDDWEIWMLLYIRYHSELAILPIK
jgi:hypothetical protein